MEEVCKLIEEEDREYGSAKVGIYVVYLSNATETMSFEKIQAWM